MVITIPGVGSVYLATYADKDGDWLDGAKSYTLHIPANPPAEQFWSITVYSWDSRTLIDNEQKRAAQSSRDDLVKNADGSIDLYGWYRPDGQPQEQVYDVAWSDGRKIDSKTGKLPPVGNTVNIKKATYKNTIGDTQFAAVWTDPDFEASQHAVYYARVIEIPTPRWTTYDAAKLGVEPPASVPATLQERAWSSPIWYIPPF